MAELSNQLLAVAVLGYLAAMVGYLVVYVFGGRGVRRCPGRGRCPTGRP